jgi:hypothetical protein
VALTEATAARTAGKTYETATSFKTFGSDLRDRAAEYARYWGYYNVTTMTTLPSGLVAHPLTFAAFKLKFK